MVGGGRWLRCAMAATILALVLPATPARAAAGSASGTDLEFVRRVHLTAAGIDAATALAQKMSATAAITKLAAQVGTQNDQLDKLARSTAGGLKVPLTDPLSADQRAALATLQQDGGAEFDAGYVRYLYQVDGLLLPISMTVKAITHNAAVRRLAERTDTIIAAQLPMLQGTGLLDMAVLPAPATSSAAVAHLPGGVPMDQKLMAQTRSGAGFLSMRLWLLLSILVGATAVAVVLTWRLRNRSGSGRSRGRRRVRPAHGR